jgi:hypothetical protein
MKYLTFSFLVLVLAFGVEIKAQGESANNASNSNSCEQYKIGIITPSKEIDFKLTIIVPPKDIDTAMVINPCPAHSQIAAAAPQPIIPPKETSEFFKVPPFTVKNRYYAQEVSLRF